VYPEPVVSTKYVIIRLRSRTGGYWFVDPSLRDRLVEDARDRGTSISDVILTILAKRVGVPYVPTGRAADQNTDAAQITVRIPMPILHGLRALSASPRGMQNVIRETLSAHYGLRVPGSPRSLKTAAAA
jgi:hypothetical protein